VKYVKRGHPPGVWAIVGDGGDWSNGVHLWPVLETWRKEKKSGKYVWILRDQRHMQIAGDGKGTYKKHTLWAYSSFYPKVKNFKAGVYRVRIRSSWDFALSYSRWVYITAK
jgi:hypothetical protein